MSSIQERAKAELDLINFGEEDTAVMLEILARFFRQWDSGGAVSVAAPVLCRLLDGKPLSPITGEDDEWIDRSEFGAPLWQNMRLSTVFKDDKSAWDIENPDHMPITFPYLGYEPELSRTTIVMPELTPDQEKAFEEEWSKPTAGILYATDPGPAIGDAFTVDHIQRGKEWMGIDLADGPDQHVEIGPDHPAHPTARYKRFEEAVAGAVNSCSMENGSNTPDFLLGKFLSDVLRATDALVTARAKWYGGDITYWKGRLEAEGAHTEAAQAEIERLNRLLEPGAGGVPIKGDWP